MACSWRMVLLFSIGSHVRVTLSTLMVLLGSSGLHHDHGFSHTEWFLHCLWFITSHLNRSMEAVLLVLNSLLLDLGFSQWEWFTLSVVLRKHPGSPICLVFHENGGSHKLYGFSLVKWISPISRFFKNILDYSSKMVPLSFRGSLT